MLSSHIVLEAAVILLRSISDLRALAIQAIRATILGVFLLISPNILSAQSNPFFYQTNDNTVLTEVLGELELRFDIEFAFSYTDFSKIYIKQGSWEGVSLESFLFKMLEPHQVLFKKSGKKKYLLRIHDTPKPAYENWDMYLEGEIYDKENRSPLAGVAVFIRETGIGTLSNEQGFFQLRVPRKYKDALLSFRLYAYKELSLKVANASLSSRFPLHAEQLSVDPITIEANHAENQGLNATSVLPGNWEKVAEASNLAGSDVLRTLQMLPGLSAFDDMNSELKIRGSGGDETLIILDEIPIYRADHYYGIFSSISSNYLENVELYKNILPLEYGGKTGGMLLMKGPDKLEEFSGHLDLNLLSTSANLRIPLGKKHSLILNGRTTLGNAAHTHFFESLGRKPDLSARDNLDFTRLKVIQTEPDFRFDDVNGKLNLSLGENAGLRLSFFKSQDQLANAYQVNFRNLAYDFVVLNKEAFSETQSWATKGASLQFYSLLSSKWKVESKAFFTDYDESSTLVSSLVRVNRQGIRRLERINTRANQILDIGGGMNARRYFGQDSWEIGVNATGHKTFVDFLQTQESVLRGNTKTYELNLYSSYQISRSNYQLDIGNRVNYYGLNQKVYFSPRIHASYNPTQQLKLKGAWGISTQFVREVVHENQLGRSINYFIAADAENYPVGRSENYMLGFTWSKGPWTLDVEGFYRNLDGVVAHALVSPGLDSLATPVLSQEYKLYVGEGKAKGVDFFLGFDSKIYTSWLAYTLSKTTYQNPDIFGGQPFSSQDDRRHQFKWVNSLKVGDFTLSANYIFSSGRAYVDISDLSRIRNRADLSPQSLINRLPAYQRIDLGLSYSFRFGKNSGSLGLSVFNIMNRENVEYLQYIYTIPITKRGTSTRAEVIGTQSNLLDRTLNMTLKLDLR